MSPGQLSRGFRHTICSLRSSVLLLAGCCDDSLLWLLHMAFWVLTIPQKRSGHISDGNNTQVKSNNRSRQLESPELLSPICPKTVSHTVGQCGLRWLTLLVQSEPSNYIPRDRTHSNKQMILKVIKGSSSSPRKMKSPVSHSQTNQLS